MLTPGFKNIAKSHLKKNLPRPAIDVLIRGKQFLCGGLETKRMEETRPLDIVIGGVPRSGTTIAAKFLSLHEDIFCYAGETHILPTLHSFFASAPCHPQNRARVSRHFNELFRSALVEVPRYGVEMGAHKGNLLFDEKDVEHLVGWLEAEMMANAHGTPLAHTGLAMLRTLLADKSGRALLGEKTPTNIFAMAEARAPEEMFYIPVVREPFGVVRSMQARVEGGDAYAGVFDGGVEANIGIYLEFTKAVVESLKHANSMLVRYEEFALDPAGLITRMMGALGKVPDDRALKFVEGSRVFDQEVADRAPMQYIRLNLQSHAERFSPVERWKIINLTRQIREAAGYDDNLLRAMNLYVEQEWPLDEIPAVVLPLWGFHLDPGISSLWMKKKASLVAYIPAGKEACIRLNFASYYPDYMAEFIPQSLRGRIGERLASHIDVGSGPRQLSMLIDVQPEELQPIGVHGHFAIIDLEAASSWIPFVHSPDNQDLREFSFQLVDWKID